MLLEIVKFTHEIHSRRSDSSRPRSDASKIYCESGAPNNSMAGAFSAQIGQVERNETRLLQRQATIGRDNAANGWTQVLERTLRKKDPTHFIIDLRILAASGKRARPQFLLRTGLAEARAAAAEGSEKP